jgi:hypothetical protein
LTELKKQALKYSEEVLKSSDKIARIIYELINENNI